MVKKENDKNYLLWLFHMSAVTATYWTDAKIDFNLALYSAALFVICLVSFFLAGILKRSFLVWIPTIESLLWFLPFSTN